LNKKIKMLLIILLIFNMFLAYDTIKKFEKEVVNLNDFTDYYTESEADNGGYQLLSSDFKVYEKQYIIVSEKTQEESTKRSKVMYYKVESGDTLGGISNKFGQSQMVLKYNNPNIEKTLKIGEKLKITRGNSITYRVVKGDSLSKIASKFEKTVEELKKSNNLMSNTIRLNQTLTINNPKINLAKITKNKKEFDVYWPVVWKGVTSPYGRRFHPVLKRWIGHMGVDLRAHYVDVKSSESGTVKYAGWMSGYGKIVIIRHSKGYETRYAHLNKIKVNKGQRVKRGQLIAESGKTGRVTGPHLHYEIRKNGTPINPMKYFK
jgi:murein DD-endopeptidase MepM/ murein hydrolase activator NlpD